MKIIHYVLSDRYAGMEQHVNELAAEQSISNEVILITNPQIKKFFNRNLKIIESRNYGRRNIHSMFFLNKIIKNEKPDIVHSHGSKTTQLLNRIKYFLKFNHVASIHGVKTNISMYLKADSIIGSSKKIQNLFRNKINVIENWYNPIFNNSIDSKAEKKYYLTIGRLEDVKNYETLIECWKTQNEKLLIIGTGSKKNKLLDIIKETQQNHKISIIPEVNINELVYYYRNAKALIVSSKREGGPRVALEALAMNVPVLSTPVGHMSDLLPNELIADSHNYEDLKALLNNNLKILDQFNFETIFEFVKNEYSLPKKCNEVLRVYKSLDNDL